MHHKGLIHPLDRSVNIVDKVSAPGGIHFASSRAAGCLMKAHLLRFILIGNLKLEGF